MSFVSEFVKTIHNECSNHDVCVGCSFLSEEGECLFREYPEMWDTEKIISAYYKILKGGGNK